MSAFPYVFGLLMRALHTTEMLISGVFPRASRRFRASPPPQAAPGPRAGGPRGPAAAADGTLIPSGPSTPRCPGVPGRRAEARTPHIPAGTRCRGAQLDASHVPPAETTFPVSFAPQGPSPGRPPARPRRRHLREPRPGPQKSLAAPGTPPGLSPGTPYPRCPAEGRGAPAAPHGSGAVPGGRPRAGRGGERS